MTIDIKALRALVALEGHDDKSSDSPRFYCAGCHKMHTRCECRDIAWEALPALLDAYEERDRLRAEWENAETGWNASLALNATLRAELEACKVKLADPRRVVIHETEVVATKDEIAALKVKLVECAAQAYDDCTDNGVYLRSDFIKFLESNITAATETP